jgi:hypothetical protein
LSFLGTGVINVVFSDPGKVLALSEELKICIN